MPDTQVSTLDATIHKTNVWLEELGKELGDPHRENAYAVLSTVLWALREHLTLEETGQFAAQLPLLVKGIFFHQWDPTGKPVKERRLEEFLERVAAGLRARRLDVRPEAAAQAVFALLSRKLSEGEIEDVVRLLPEAIRRFWPEAVRTSSGETG